MGRKRRADPAAVARPSVVAVQVGPYGGGVHALEIQTGLQKTKEDNDTSSPKFFVQFTKNKPEVPSIFQGRRWSM